MQRLLIMCAGVLLFAGVLALPTEDAQSAAGGRGHGHRTPSPHEAPERSGPEVGLDRCAICRHAERLGIQLTPVYGVVRFRCCDEPVFAMRWPGGRMRPEDLDSLPMQLSMRFDVDAFERSHVRILAGEHLLHAETTKFSDADWWKMTSVYRVHSQARDALRGVRSKLTFSLRFEGYGPELRRQFWLENPEPALQARIHDMRLAVREDERASKVAWLPILLEAQAYWDAGFDFAAEKLARRVLKQRPEEPHALAIQFAVYRVQRFEYTCAGQRAGASLQEAMAQLTKAERVCHLRAGFDPVAGRVYVRPRAGCGPGQRRLWGSR